MLYIGESLLNGDSALRLNELLGVIAHELGHWRLHHLVLTYLAVEAGLLGLVLATYLLRYFHPLYTVFGYSSKSNGPWLPTRFLIVSFCLFIALGEFYAPLLLLLARHTEYQADAHAASLGYAKSLCSALVKMQNGTFLVMDPLFKVLLLQSPIPG